jgi:4-aminobutyrate aminotransferase-like enzyme
LVADRDGRAPAPERCAAAMRALRERGVIVGRGGRHGSVVKLSPALVIEEDDLDAGLAAVIEVLA